MPMGIMYRAGDGMGFAARRLTHVVGQCFVFVMNKMDFWEAPFLK